MATNTQVVSVVPCVCAVKHCDNKKSGSAGLCSLCEKLCALCVSCISLPRIHEISSRIKQLDIHDSQFTIPQRTTEQYQFSFTFYFFLCHQCANKVTNERLTTHDSRYCTHTP